MKKLTLFTLASVLILSLLAGCSGTPAPDAATPSPSPSAETTTAAPYPASSPV